MILRFPRNILLVWGDIFGLDNNLHRHPRAENSSQAPRRHRMDSQLVSPSYRASKFTTLIIRSKRATISMTMCVPHFVKLLPSRLFRTIIWKIEFIGNVQLLGSCRTIKWQRDGKWDWKFFGGSFEEFSWRGECTYRRERCGYWLTFLWYRCHIVSLQILIDDRYQPSQVSKSSETPRLD